MSRMSPEPTRFLLTIRTPAHEFDWRDPAACPHELVECHRFDSFELATDHLAREHAPVYGQTFMIEAVYPSDPRNFIDWSALRASV